MMQRYKGLLGNPLSGPGTPWLVGAMIGLTIMTMASGAMTLGASLALGKAGSKSG
jgi:hypothetical protein